VFGPRTVLVGVLPTAALGFAVVAQVWAGAPGPIRWSDAARTVSGLTAAQFVVLFVALALLVVVLQPMQLPVVRLLEGYWPRWLAPLTCYGTWRQSRRRAVLVASAELHDDGVDDPVAVQRAGRRGTILRTMFPVIGWPVRPTALGNVLAAAEARAGSEYGLDAVTAWPRLYPLLDEHTKAIVDDRRTTLDALARLSVTAAVAAVVSVVLLWRSGWWLLLGLILVALARIAYRGAVLAASAYGEALCAAFDLTRFALLRRMRLPLPGNQTEERVLNEALCTMWRQAPRATVLTYHDEEAGPGAR
jgi:hypothetical protein